MSAGLCVVGAAGRMGAVLLDRLAAHSQLHLSSALVAPGEILELPDAVVSADPREALLACEVAIDFSAPAACAATMPVAAELGRPYVLASTGLTADDETAVTAATQQAAVLAAANMSVGVNALLALVEQASGLLDGFDVEVQEIHHHHKRDAPSGTALALGQAVHSRRSGLRDVVGRAGEGPARSADELGFACLRGGDVAGEHTVYFFGGGERVELTHRATSPAIFADGALVAASWLIGRAPGRYSMRDVLGI